MTTRLAVKKLTRTKVQPKKKVTSRRVKEQVTYQLDVHIAAGNEYDKELVETIIGKDIYCDEGAEILTFFGDDSIITVPIHRLVFARRYQYITEEHKEAADAGRNDQHRVV